MLRPTAKKKDVLFAALDGDGDDDDDDLFGGTTSKDDPLPTSPPAEVSPVRFEPDCEPLRPMGWNGGMMMEWLITGVSYPPVSPSCLLDRRNRRRPLRWPTMMTRAMISSARRPANCSSQKTHPSLQLSLPRYGLPPWL